MPHLYATFALPRCVKAFCICELHNSAFWFVAVPLCVKLCMHEITTAEFHPVREIEIRGGLYMLQQRLGTSLPKTRPSGCSVQHHTPILLNIDRRPGG